MFSLLNYTNTFPKLFLLYSLRDYYDVVYLAYKNTYTIYIVSLWRNTTGEHCFHPSK